MEDFFCHKAINKRIFHLTDGEVTNPFEVINQAKVGNDLIRIHTFGIGNACDARLVQETAKSGRGSCSMVADKNGQLNASVV